MCVPKLDRHPLKQLYYLIFGETYHKILLYMYADNCRNVLIQCRYLADIGIATFVSISYFFYILKLGSFDGVHTGLIEVIQIAVGFVWLLVWIICASFLLSQVPEGYTFGSSELEIWKIERSIPTINFKIFRLKAQQCLCNLY